MNKSVLLKKSGENIWCEIDFHNENDNIIYNIEQYDKFDLFNLPERTDIFSILKIYETYNNLSDFSAFSYPSCIDTIFSSIFYTKIESFIKKSDDEIVSILQKQCLETPYRKFKAVIPYLLSGCQKDMIDSAYAGEIIFGAATILDDICDNRKTRYGSPSVLSSFSYKTCIAIAYNLPFVIEKYINNNTNLGNSSMELSKSMQLLGDAQFLRFENCSFTDIEKYLSISIRRTHFLGTLWYISLKKAGCKLESKLIKDIYPEFASLGQIVNDYYDLEISKNRCDDTPPVFTDIANRTINYYVLVLINKLTEDEKNLFYRDVWGRSEPKARDFLSKLITKYRIVNEIKHEIINRITLIKSKIDSSSISHPKKVILKSWVDLQFSHHVMNIDNKKSLLDEFMMSVNELLK